MLGSSGALHGSMQDGAKHILRSCFWNSGTGITKVSGRSGPILKWYPVPHFSDLDTHGHLGISHPHLYFMGVRSQHTHAHTHGGSTWIWPLKYNNWNAPSSRAKVEIARHPGSEHSPNLDWDDFRYPKDRKEKHTKKCGKLKVSL